MSAHFHGCLRTTPIGLLADRLARAIQSFAEPRGIGIEPDGRCYVDIPDHIPESDLMGVYSDVGLLALSRTLIEDLRHELVARELRPRLSARVVRMAA